jgi:hypothetical protein
MELQSSKAIGDSIEKQTAENSESLIKEESQLITSPADQASSNMDQQSL